MCHSTCKCLPFHWSSYYSFLWIGDLVAKFNPIMLVLLRKLHQLEALQFSPDNGFLFGFSFGTVLCYEAGYQFGPQRLYRIDACDPITSLYYSSTSAPVLHANQSAKYVTCIHTSADFGTVLRFCPIDIDMGICGDIQPGAALAMTTSHQLCPIFYVNAFDNDFQLVPKPIFCINSKFAPDVTVLPPMVMGYRMDVNAPPGEYYSNTGVIAPYNVVMKVFI